MLSSRALLCILSLLVASASALYSSKSPVKQLDETSFNSEVVNSDGVVYVEFAPWCGHCKSLTPHWEEAAKSLKGIVTIAAVDATENPGLAQQFGVQGYPTIKVFGADKRKPTDYKGARTGAAITADALDQVQKLVRSRQGGKSENRQSSKTYGNFPGKVQKVDAADFSRAVLKSSEPWIVAFVASWCGHCKALKPEFSGAAKELLRVTNLAYVVESEANKALMQKYQVQGFPTILIFDQDKKNPQPYKGERSKGAIVTAAKKMKTAGQKSEQAPPSDGDTDKDTGKEAPAPAPEPPKPVEVVQLTSSDVFTELCKGTGLQKLCLIAVLPHLVEGGAAARQQYLAQFKSAGDKMKTTLFTYLWSEAGVQSSLESTFGLTFGYPALIALSLDKKAYATHMGSFDEGSVASFMSGLMAGSTRIAPFTAVPNIEASEPWDGADYAPPQEEEMSLDELFADEL